MLLERSLRRKTKKKKRKNIAGKKYELKEDQPNAKFRSRDLTPQPSYKSSSFKFSLCAESSKFNF